jgi:hypothetical protein
MSLFGHLLKATGSDLERRVVERAVLSDPFRRHAIGELAGALMDAGDIRAADALGRALDAVQRSEVALLDTNEGRAVVFADAMEAMFAAPVVQTRTRP